ncbi:hypothetical protein EDD11_010467 [Mortierella claussenii]|nr:hypothetical protein EDD11_010467 [Mortierella claussenii]
MSSYSTYQSHDTLSQAGTNRPALNPLAYSADSKSRSRSVSPTHYQNDLEDVSHHIHSSSSSTQSALPPIYTTDYTPNCNSQNGTLNSNNTICVVTDSTLLSPSPKGSPTSTLHSTQISMKEASPPMGFSNTPPQSPTRWKRFRLKVMKMATVERLQLLWGLLALFGTMSWLALMPAYAFRNKVDAAHFKAPVYTFFLVATVCTSLSAIWQSLCPFLVRQSQRALLPRVINHPATQTATIVISVLLTILNFFSWIVVASDKDYGAKTDCHTGLFSDKDGYLVQCRGVNVAVVLNVIVFILWIPISLVIICGTIERGLWWWGEDDGWAQNEAIVGGSNVMSEEEFDMKIGLGGSKRIKRRQTVHPENLSANNHSSDMVMIQQPKPAFVTPIASQFRSSSAFGLEGGENGDDDDFTNFTPSSYRRHHQQRQQRQQQQQQQQGGGGGGGGGGGHQHDMSRRLNRRGSSNSLSSRLSTFFGAGWGSGIMPPEAEQPPMPEMPSQYRQENASRQNLDLNNNNNNNNGNNSGSHRGGGANKENKTSSPSSSRGRKEESKQEVPEPEPAALLHGAEYTSQWHSRRYDDWS